MSEPASVYVFRDPSFAPAGDTIVCAAPIDLVVSVYGGGGLKGEGGLADVFGGAVLFRNEETGSSYLGVWGSRNASRFRTALRARVAFDLVHAAPPARLVWYQTKNTRPKVTPSIEEP